MITGIISNPSGWAVAETSAHQFRSIIARPVNRTPMPAARSTQRLELRIERLRSNMRSKNWSRCIAETDREACSDSTVITSNWDLMLCSLSRVAVRSARDCETPLSSLCPLAGAGPSVLNCWETSARGTKRRSDLSAVEVRIFSNTTFRFVRSWSLRFGRRSIAVAPSKSTRNCCNARSLSPMIARSKARPAVIAK